MERVAYFQNALASGAVPLLAGFDAQPVPDSEGRPRIVTGTNALIAHLRRKDGTDVALRIVAPQPTTRDWTVRYTSLRHLAEQRGFRRIPGHIRVVRPERWTAATEAFVDSAMVTMDWVSGPTLFSAVNRATQAGNRAVLRALGTGFVQLWNDMQVIGFVHGDLSGHNVMVKGDGQLTLVDLDTASWPEAPFGSPGNGTPGFRPPARSRDAQDRDSFAALVIMVSLRVLADNPGLRSRYGGTTDRSGEAFLFGENDLRRLAASPAFAEARREVSSPTMALLDALEAAATGGPDSVMDALTLLPNVTVPRNPGKASPGDAAWDVAPVVERMRAHYADSWGSDSQPEASWENAASDPWSSGNDIDWPVIPPSASSGEMGRGPTNRTTGAADIAELRGAAERGDTAEVRRIWSDVQQDDLGSLVALDVERMEAASIDRRIAEEFRLKHDHLVIDFAAEAERQGLPLEARTRQLVREAKERWTIQGELEGALASGNSDQLAELALTGRLAQAGETDRHSLRQVLQAIELPQLDRALAADDDLLILEAVDDELFGGEDAVSREVSARVSLARERLEWLRKARVALRKRESAGLLAMLVNPPVGVIERLSGPERRRMRQVIEGQKALDDLERALSAGKDGAVISALNRVERAGARIPERKTWARIQEVLERMSVVDSLLVAAESHPPDMPTLTYLLPTVKAMGMDRDARLTSELIERLEALVTRMAHVRRIQAAIARDHDIAIVNAAVPDPHGAMELLTEQEQRRVRQAIQSRQRPGS